MRVDPEAVQGPEARTGLPYAQFRKGRSYSEDTVVPDHTGNPQAVIPTGEQKGRTDNPQRLEARQPRPPRCVPPRRAQWWVGKSK